MICDAEEGRSGQFRSITCKIKTSDPNMLNPCCQGVGHAVNFDQLQVKSHEGLTCVRMCEFFKLVFLTRSIEYSLVRARFRQVPLFFLQARVFISPCEFFNKVLCLFCKPLSIHQSMCVFGKLHQRLSYNPQCIWFSPQNFA